MGAISALSTTGRTLARNGVLIGAAVLVALVNLLPTGLSALLPPSAVGLVSLPLSGLSLLVTPFFMGGLLSMADEGLDGTARFGTFLAGGREHYLRLLAAMLLFAVAFLVILLALAVVGAFAVGASAGSVATSGGSVAALAVAGVVALLAVGLPLFFLQFYAAAVVVSDLDVVASFERSAGLVRRNLVSTLGYSVVALALGAVGGVVGGVLTLLGGLAGQGAATGAEIPELGSGVLLAVGAVTVLVTALLSAFGATYQVAFYDDCLDSLA